MKNFEIGIQMTNNEITAAEGYEAPQVELVLNSEAIERQAFYAGSIISCPGGDCPPPQL